jgi:hypothetical protein
VGPPAGVTAPTLAGGSGAGAVDSPVTADDLDRVQLDQLHVATLKASDSCFELKKLCATILVPTISLVAVFTDKRLNLAVFVAGVLLVGGFVVFQLGAVDALQGRS